MLAKLKSLWEAVLSLFTRSKSVGRTKYVKRTHKSEIGEFESIKSLLGDLDTTFFGLERIVRDPIAGKFVRAWGTFIVPSSATNNTEVDETNLGAGFKAYGLPTVLSVYFKPTKAEEHECVPLIFARKVHRVRGVVFPKNKQMYEVGGACYFKGPKTKTPTQTVLFHVAVDRESGEVFPLREYLTLTNVLRTKHGKTYIPNTHLGYPTLPIVDAPESMGMEKILTRMFCFAFNATMLKETGINVRITKGKLSVVVNVPPDRWKYFFKDRIDVIHRGVKKRIFHTVAAHTRKGKSKEANVKTHYRGIRRFEWGGYSICITVPGKHKVADASFNVESYDPTRIPREFEAGGRWMEDEEVAQKLRSMEVH